MPSDRLVLGLANASPFAPPPNRPSRPNRMTDRGSVGTILRDLRRHLDLAVREQTGPWIPRITARYPY